MSRNIGRLRFRKDDPLRYLHVPAAERKDTDEGDFSDATDEVTGEPEDFDRDAVRAHTEVIPERYLQ